MRKFWVRLFASFLLICVVLFLPLMLIVHRLDGVLFWLVGLAFLVAALALAGLLTYINHLQVTKPMRSILNVSKKLSSGDYSARIKNEIRDADMRKLVIAVNNIANELENLEQMRKSFVSNTSHELRSPLTSMQGFLQAMLDGTIPPEDVPTYLEIVFSETKRLASLVNSMLDLSRLESGKNPLKFSKFGLNDLVKRAALRFEPNLFKKELQLDIDFASEETEVFADKDKIEQVVVNLIDNAIKYSYNRAKILVTTHLSGKKAWVSIKDQGCGISKKDQMFIWDRFYMVDKARTPNKSASSGLGLSIVKKIVDDHKESIWVESTKGQGSTFIFTVPLFDKNKHKEKEDE